MVLSFYKILHSIWKMWSFVFAIGYSIIILILIACAAKIAAHYLIKVQINRELLVRYIHPDPLHPDPLHDNNLPVTDNPHTNIELTTCVINHINEVVSDYNFI